MICSVLTLHTDPERAEQVLEFFREKDILQESLDLTREESAYIALAADGSGEIVVIAQWPDEQAYQEWADHPRRERNGPQLQKLLEGVRPGVARLYNIDHTVSRA